MVREYHVAVFPANHVSVLCMELCVSGEFHAQYTYIIGPGVQPRGAPGPCKYFSKRRAWQVEGQNRPLANCNQLAGSKPARW